MISVSADLDDLAEGGIARQNSTLVATSPSCAQPGPFGQPGVTLDLR